METINVAICADDRYAPGLIVTLGTLLLHADPSVTINALVLDCGISDGTWALIASAMEKCVTLARLQRLELMINSMSQQRGIAGQVWNCLSHGAEKRGPGMRLQRLPIDRSQLRDLPPGQHGSDAVYARLILPELLPDVPAVVYLDSDILFFRDIAEFWRLPLGGCAAIVCKDEILRCLGNDSPAPDAERAGEPYFNSGLMLIDLDYWRRHGVGRQAIEFLARHGNACRFWDQTALNALLVGKVRYADPRWNRFAMTDPEVFLADRFNVHLISRNKPWLQPSEDFYPQLWYLIYHAIMDRKWTFA